MIPHIHCSECGLGLELPEPDSLTLTLCPRGHEVFCPLTRGRPHRCNRCMTAFLLDGETPKPAPEATEQPLAPVNRPGPRERRGIAL